MAATVVIDKNFLQGASQEVVHSLMQRYELVMPGALFFELMTTDSVARRKCFSKLPPVVNPVHLVDHIGVLLRFEIAERRSCGLPSDHRVKFSFQFNERLSEESYKLPVDAQVTLDAQIADACEAAFSLIDLSETTPDLFPGLLVGTTEQQASEVAEVEKLIANVEAVPEFYSHLESPDPALPYPPIQHNPASWAHIRWLQVKMLFAADLYVRYRGRLRELATPNVLRKLEHDVHDAQILALGVMEGALVTREQKLLRWFRLLRPDGWVSTGAA